MRPPRRSPGSTRTSGPAAGGTAVTITGTNFTGATAVKFGTTAATTFTVNSATSITATAPAGVGGHRGRDGHRPGGHERRPAAADQFTYGTTSTATISAVGQHVAPGRRPPATTLAVSPQHVGDLLALAVQGDLDDDSASSVTGRRRRHLDPGRGPLHGLHRPRPRDLDRSRDARRDRPPSRWVSRAA